MPGIHARYSPSHAAVWGTCTASVRAEENIPETDSEYAAEGTLAHAIAELKLCSRFGLLPADVCKSRLDMLRADPLYQKEMEEYTDIYADEIMKVCCAFPEKPYVIVEKRLDMGHIVPDCFGTADCIVLYGTILHIFDFKYGKGVSVSAENNPQLRLYALGAIGEYSVFGKIKTVFMNIIQPRIDNICSACMPAEELTAWGDKFGRRVKASIAAGGEFVPGEHCRFCKAKAKCRARAEMLLSAEEQKAREDRGEMLTDEEIGEVLLRAQLLAGWVKGLEEYVYDKLLRGEPVPHWKLVEGRSVRAISDINGAFAALEAAGYGSELLYERKPLGLTALEKLCGRKKLTELIGNYITKPSGKPTLVPESDKRKAFSQTRIAEMFKDN